MRVQKKMGKSNQHTLQQQNIIYIFRVDSLCECYDLPHGFLFIFLFFFLFSRQVEAVRKVLGRLYTLYGSPALCLPSNFKLPAVIFLKPFPPPPSSGHPFYLNRKKFRALWLLACRIL